MYWVGIALGAVFIGVLLLALVEIRQYRTGRRLISRRRFVIRMVAAVLMLAVTAAVFVGLFVLGLRTPAGRPILWLAWWGACVVCGILLMFLALADAKEVEAISGQRERELWRDFARTMIGKGEKQGDPRSGSDEQR